MDLLQPSMYRHGFRLGREELPTLLFVAVEAAAGKMPRTGTLCDGDC